MHIGNFGEKFAQNSNLGIFVKNYAKFNIGDFKLFSLFIICAMGPEAS